MDGIEQAPDRGDAIDGQAGQPRVGDDQALVRRVVDAVHLVVGDEAVDPLDVRPEVGQGLRDFSDASRIWVSDQSAMPGTMRSMTNFGMGS